MGADFLLIAVRGVFDAGHNVGLEGVSFFKELINTL